MTYQTEALQQERQEYFNDCVQVAVEAEVKRIIETATCFECDNPLTVLETEDGGIAVRACQKCNPSKIDTAFMQGLMDMDVVIGKINGLTKQINGRG